MPDHAAEITERVDLAGLQKLARGIASALNPRTLILLDGPMGAGKTQFTRFFMEALGSRETVSPSFAIHNSYRTKDDRAIEHFDLFRLENEDDLESTGFWDFFRESEGVILIEWASRLNEMRLEANLPRTWPTISIQIDFVESSSRPLRRVEIKRRQ